MTAAYGELAAQLLGTPDSGSPQVLAAYMTEWDAGTYANTVALGGASWSNLPVLNPSSLAVGPVVVLVTGGAPLVLGRIFRAAT